MQEVVVEAGDVLGQRIVTHDATAAPCALTMGVGHQLVVLTKQRHWALAELHVEGSRWLLHTFYRRRAADTLRRGTVAVVVLATLDGCGGALGSGASRLKKSVVGECVLHHRKMFVVVSFVLFNYRLR